MTAEQYLKEHGINEESVKRFHITSDDHELNIPIKNIDDQIIWTKHRNLDYDPDDKDSKKYINDTGSKVALFNIRSHSTKKTIILTEGEIDAIKLDQEGIPAISPTAGAETFNRELANQLQNKTVYIVYDNDEAGKKGIRKVLEFIPNAKILELPLDSKDVCDFFTLHTKEDFIQIIKEAKTKEDWEIKYQPDEYSVLTATELLNIEYPEEEWIIDRVVPQSGFVMFVGEAGAGKSYIALDAIKAITGGGQFLDHFEVKTLGAVLVIDMENGLRRLQKRIKGMEFTNTDNIYFLKYPELFGLLEENIKFMESVSNLIKAKNITMVVLDSFIDFIESGSENASEDTNKIFKAFRSIAPEIAYFVLHHDTKPQGKEQRTAGQKTRGSTNIMAQLVNQFYISKTKNPKIINIEQGKARDSEPTPKFQIEFITGENDQMSGFRYLGEAKDEVKMIEEVIELVFEYLQSNGATIRQDIMDYIKTKGFTERTTRDALSSLKNKGLIDSQKRSGYGNKAFFFISGDNSSDVNENGASELTLASEY